MKVTQRIPTSTYAYIEFEKEYDGVEDAVSDHKHILSLYQNKSGLSTNDWAKVRNQMLQTGECDPELLQEMSDSQRWWINQTKLAMRAATADDPIID